jgi:hypothetical protein
MTPEIDGYDYKILRRAASKPLYRGLFGWPFSFNMLSFGMTIIIRELITYGYVEFFYDWEKDRPALKTTSLGLSRLVEHEERGFMAIRA